jgi:tryptophanyl-tRNA synthetase
MSQHQQAPITPLRYSLQSRQQGAYYHWNSFAGNALRRGLFLASSDRATVAATDTSPSISASSTTTATTTTRKKKVQTRRILSGVQPTGSLHLGNYLGAIKQWVDFQNTGVFAGAQTPSSSVSSSNNSNDKVSIEEEEEEEVEIINENYFCVVDMHAITVPQNPSELEESSLASAALYIAVGIDPTKSKIFIQSHVSAHAELAWLLNCITPMNWLERMIQYKDKAATKKDTVGVGLFTYPVLMAADILLYQADRVPVGEDQRQHLELARDIVRRFNNDYCKGNAYKARCKKAGLASRPVFTEPEAMIISSSSSSSSDNSSSNDGSSDGNNSNNNTGGVGGVARVMSLTDGTSKMSKSDPADNSRINILDTPDVIRDKIKRCKTDSITGGLTWNDPNRPEATNLLNIYAAVQPHRSKEDIILEVQGMKWGEFKPKLAEAIIEHLEPIQRRYAEVRADETYLRNVLNDGAIAAEQIAQQTLLAAKVAMGFTIRK